MHDLFTIGQIDSMVEEMADLADELSNDLEHPRKNTRLYEIQLKFDTAMGRKMLKAIENGR